MRTLISRCEYCGRGLPTKAYSLAGHGRTFEVTLPCTCDRAMEAQLEETKRQLIRERKDKEKLEEEVSRLQKALKKKDINLLRKL
jgi:hypothetical protein